MRIPSKNDLDTQGHNSNISNEMNLNFSTIT